jgi:hypothetical protein
MENSEQKRGENQMKTARHCAFGSFYPQPTWVSFDPVMSRKYDIWVPIARRSDVDPADIDCDERFNAPIRGRSVVFQVV